MAELVDLVHPGPNPAGSDLRRGGVNSGDLAAARIGRRRGEITAAGRRYRAGRKGRRLLVPATRDPSPRWAAAHGDQRRRGGVRRRRSPAGSARRRGAAGAGLAQAAAGGAGFGGAREWPVSGDGRRQRRWWSPASGGGRPALGKTARRSGSGGGEIRARAGPGWAPRAAAAERRRSGGGEIRARAGPGWAPRAAVAVGRRRDRWRAVIGRAKRGEHVRRRGFCSACEEGGI